MPLPLPRLDVRTYAELVDEGRSLLPLLAPGWTDHNASDPGITLLELLASVVETTSYRLDRTQPATLRAYLRLVGVEPHPARVARTVLAVHGAAAALPAGLQVSDTAGTVRFQTAQPLLVSPARLVAVLVGTEADALDRGKDNEAGTGYPALGAEPARGDALYLGFDRPLGPSAARVALFVWTGAPDLDRALQAELVAEWRAARQDAACPPGAVPGVPHWSLHHSVRTIWEYRSGAGEWRPLAGLVDQTRAMTLSGFVRFRVPAVHGSGGPRPGLFFVRCRCVSGGYECPPRIVRVAHNAVRAHHAVDVPEELLGVSTAVAGQRVALALRGVVPGSCRLRVEPGGSWTEVLDWDRTGPHDRHHRLTPESGEITFGDGRTGRIPPAGSSLSVRYQVGGGPAGNVPVATLTTWVPGAGSTLTVTQPVPATGGAEAERLDESQGRALDMLTARDRAITLIDIETLARGTPGVPVAAARALAEYHPALPCVRAHGCVTVVVVPACPRARPEPGPDFLRAVERYLHRRRSLTTELHVIGPRFTTVEVSARLWIAGGPADPAGAARAELARFFHPFDGGPAGTGWPVGRDVYRSEVQALLTALPGVVGVDRLGLATDADPTPRCGNLPICDDSLLVSGNHRIDLSERGTP